MACLLVLWKGEFHSDNPQPSGGVCAFIVCQGGDTGTRRISWAPGVSRRGEYLTRPICTFTGPAAAHALMLRTGRGKSKG